MTDSKTAGLVGAEGGAARRIAKEVTERRTQLGIQALKTHYAGAGKSGSQEEKQAIDEYVRQQQLRARTPTPPTFGPGPSQLHLSNRTGTADAFARQLEEEEIQQGVHTLKRYYAGQGKSGTTKETQAIAKYISNRRLEFEGNRHSADAELLAKRGAAAAPENPFADYKGPSIDAQLRAEGLLPSDPRYQQRASQMMLQFINRKEAWDKEIQRAEDMKFSLSTPTVYFKFENLHGEQAMQGYLRGQGLRQNTYDWERERESVQRQMRQGQQFLASLYQAKQQGGNLGRGIAIGNVSNIAQKQYAKIKSEYERETRALIEERQKDTRQLSRAIREELEAKLKARLDSLRRKAQKELDEAYRKYSRISSSQNGTFLSGALYGIANPDVNPQSFRAAPAAPPAFQDVTATPVGAPDPTKVLAPLGGGSESAMHTFAPPKTEPRNQVYFATVTANVAPEVVTTTTSQETVTGVSCGGANALPIVSSSPPRRSCFELLSELVREHSDSIRSLREPPDNLPPSVRSAEHPQPIPLRAEEFERRLRNAMRIEESLVSNAHEFCPDVPPVDIWAAAFLPVDFLENPSHGRHYFLDKGDLDSIDVVSGKPIREILDRWRFSPIDSLGRDRRKYVECEYYAGDGSTRKAGQSGASSRLWHSVKAVGPGSEWEISTGSFRSICYFVTPRIGSDKTPIPRGYPKQLPAAPNPALYNHSSGWQVAGLRRKPEVFEPETVGSVDPRSDNRYVVHLRKEGRVPFDSFAPAIQYDFWIELSFLPRSNLLNWSVGGSHRLFPDYEMMVAGNLAYKNARGSPWDLLLRGTERVSGRGTLLYVGQNEWWPVLFSDPYASLGDVLRNISRWEPPRK